MPPLADIAATWWPVLLAYLVGATPFGYLAGRLRGIDIREHGSGNIGATNVLRTLGKPVGFAVLILDVLKGLVPALLARSVSDGSLVPIFTAVAAILGHNYTFWLGFKGGKGIATTAGAMAPLLFWPLVAAVLGWLILLKTTRYVSVASIGAAAIIPLAVTVLSLARGVWEWPLFLLSLLVFVLAVWRHRENIRRLCAGTENRFAPKKERAGNPGKDPPADRETEPTETIHTP